MQKTIASVDARADTSAYRYVVVVTLAVVYGFNFLDRQLLSILAGPVKQELHLSDTQLGMLTGLTFALFYTVFGIPVAMLADRGNRVRIVALACGLWSLFSAASGFASNFLTLSLARIGVGVGEAGCSPPSYSIIADYFPAEKRGRALAIYALGIPAGSLVGGASGSWIAAHYSWRVAFVAVGLAGLVLAPLVPLIVREPPRGQYDAAKDSGAGAGGVFEALGFFLRSPTLLLNAFSAGLMAFVSYGILNWAPAFLGRVQGMTLTQIAAVYSITLTGCMVLAAWLGAFIADVLGSRNPMNYALLPGAALVIATPFLFAFTTADGWQASLAFLAVPLLLSSIYLVPALAVLQNHTPTRYRATVSAATLFLLNLIGLGCGPLFVGAVSDRLQPQLGIHALGAALQWLTPFIGLAFLLQCATAWSIRRDRRARPS